MCNGIGQYGSACCKISSSILKRDGIGPLKHQLAMILSIIKKNVLLAFQREMKNPSFFGCVLIIRCELTTKCGAVPLFSTLQCLWGESSWLV